MDSTLQFLRASDGKTPEIVLYKIRWSAIKTTRRDGITSPCETKWNQRYLKTLLHLMNGVLLDCTIPLPQQLVTYCA